MGIFSAVELPYQYVAGTWPLESEVEGVIREDIEPVNVHLFVGRGDGQSCGDDDLDIVYLVMTKGRWDGATRCVSNRPM
jgi:hypothetical protein